MSITAATFIGALAFLESQENSESVECCSLNDQLRSGYLLHGRLLSRVRPIKEGPHLAFSGHGTRQVCGPLVTRNFWFST